MHIDARYEYSKKAYQIELNTLLICIFIIYESMKRTSPQCCRPNLSQSYVGTIKRAEDARVPSGICPSRVYCRYHARWNENVAFFNLKIIYDSFLLFHNHPVVLI